ncbi:MAG: cation transporter [Ginsengibacter sp.]
MRKKKAAKPIKLISKQSNRDYETGYRKLQLYIILCCGLLIFFIGVYLTLTSNVGIAHSLPGRYGEGGGQTLIVNGLFTLLFGLIICIFPAFQLIKQSFKKRKHPN